MIQWSALQQSIFEAVRSSDNNLLIVAAPGSGKTTTEVEALAAHTDPNLSTCAVAFGVESARQLQARLPADIDVRTVHSLGLKMLRENGYQREVEINWVADQVRARIGRSKKQAIARAFTRQLISQCKAALTEPSADRTADWQIKGYSADHCRQIAAEIMYEQQHQPTPIGFDDMIWLPVALECEPLSYDILGVDEAQDLTPAQIELVIGSGKRVIAVGDPRQSIYQWRGAASNSMDQLRSALGARTLPLSISYRCPRSVVREANRIWSGSVEAAPDAPEGTVRTQHHLGASPGDLVVARTNSPLIAACVGYWRRNIPAYMLGRDASRGLLQWIDATGAKSLDVLLSALRTWEDDAIRRVEETEDRQEAALVIDRVACLRTLAAEVRSIPDLVAAIKQLAVPQPNAVRLATTHQAKGLEADRVWVLVDSYDDCAQWGDPIEEANCRYVAVTRAREELIYVEA